MLETQRTLFDARAQAARSLAEWHSARLRLLAAAGDISEVDTFGELSAPQSAVRLNAAQLLPSNKASVPTIRCSLLTQLHGEASLATTAAANKHAH